jgi:hypothetical protein
MKTDPDAVIKAIQSSAEDIVEALADVAASIRELVQSVSEIGS